MKAPFPYFGGKSAIAHKVWEYLGNPGHYIEPFFGSGAVLLNRPGWDGQVETVCDKDGFLANVWRSLIFSPNETAEWCDWPVNHADLMARKSALIKNEDRLLENLITDDEWHDPKMAGYWIWAASCWIGSGLTRPGKRPHISDRGVGINAGQMPHIGHKGMGEIFNENIYIWFRQLQERLRFVRVVCGDWTRVCGGNWQEKLGTVGIFFDPPYGVKDRAQDLYHQESTTVSLEVEKWCLERGRRNKYRIVCAGYEGEYLSLKENGWQVFNWKAQAGYSNISKNGNVNENRKLERLFVSPNCLGQQVIFNEN